MFENKLSLFTGGKITGFIFRLFILRSDILNHRPLKIPFRLRALFSLEVHEKR